MSLPYGFVICQMLFYEMQVIIFTFSMIFRIFQDLSAMSNSCQSYYFHIFYDLQDLSGS